MNCYICREETGNCSRPVLAICQSCGAGMCESHVVEGTPIPAMGMAGTSRCLLICSRCHHVLSQSRWSHVSITVAWGALPILPSTQAGAA